MLVSLASSPRVTHKQQSIQFNSIQFNSIQFNSTMNLFPPSSLNNSNTNATNNSNATSPTIDPSSDNPSVNTNNTNINTPSNHHRSHAVVVCGYELESVIGIGTYGEVRCARQVQNGQRVAVKIVDLSRFELKS